MAIYIATIIITLLFCGFAQKYDFPQTEEASVGRVNHTSSAQILFFIVVLWLTVVAGFRYNIGTDFGAYYRGYDSFIFRLPNNLRNLNEPGFGLIALIASNISDNGTTVMLCTSALTIGLCMKTIKNNTDCLVVASLLFLFLECWHESFNAVRQCLAVAVVFAGYRYLKDARFLKYVFVIFIAFLFHKSAIALIVIYPLIRRKVTFPNITLLIIGTLAVFLSYDLIFEFQSEVLSDGIVQYGYVTNAVNIFRVLANAAPAVFFLVFRPQEPSQTTDFYTNILLIHAAIAVASSASTYLARMMMYTAPFVCIAIPELLKTVDIKIRQWAKPVILILFCAFWLYDLSISPSLTPFRFVWS